MEETGWRERDEYGRERVVAACLCIWCPHINSWSVPFVEFRERNFRHMHPQTRWTPEHLMHSTMPRFILAHSITGGGGVWGCV